MHIFGTDKNIKNNDNNQNIVNSMSYASLVKQVRVNVIMPSVGDIALIQGNLVYLLNIKLVMSFLFLVIYRDGYLCSLLLQHYVFFFFSHIIPSALEGTTTICTSSQ